MRGGGQVSSEKLTPRGATQLRYQAKYYSFNPFYARMWRLVRVTCVVLAIPCLLYILEPRVERWAAPARMLTQAYSRVHTSYSRHGGASGVAAVLLDWYRWRKQYRAPKRVTIV
jgi:hypothetical protein